MPHWPSCGVGGHCIPVDPYYLIERAKRSGFDHKFLRTSREINNSMPEYTVERLQDALNDVKLPLNGTTVGILGISYKANVDDTRESPTYKLVELLKTHKAKPLLFDPHVQKESTSKSLSDILKHSTAVIVATNHDEFIAMDLSLLKKNRVKVLIDGKNCLDKEHVKKMGIIYRGIGR